MPDTGWVLGTSATQQDDGAVFLPANGAGFTNLPQCLARTVPSSDGTATYLSIRNGGISKFLTVTAPRVTNNSASAAAGAGGTIQLTADNLPTAWTLL